MRIPLPPVKSLKFNLTWAAIHPILILLVDCLWGSYNQRIPPLLHSSLYMVGILSVFPLMYVVLLSQYMTLKQKIVWFITDSISYFIFFYGIVTYGITRLFSEQTSLLFLANLTSIISDGLFWIILIVCILYMGNSWIFTINLWNFSL
jgi:hypothetical protein